METKINYTEATEPKTANKNNKKNDAPKLWQSVLVGGVPGILIGMGGTMAYEAAAAAKSSGFDETYIEPEATEELNEIQVASLVNDDMSYSEAFAAARREVGPGGAFVWHGNVYGTYRGDDAEWLEMSAEERADHSRMIMSQVQRVPYTPAKDEPAIEVIKDETFDNEPSVEEANDNNDNDVHIIGVGVTGSVDGSILTYGVGEINDHYAEVIDLDTDGEIDAILVDTNNDGQISPDEVIFPDDNINNSLEDVLSSAVNNLDNLGEADTL